jgi:hypothetical protein
MRQEILYWEERTERPTPLISAELRPPIGHAAADGLCRILTSLDSLNQVCVTRDDEVGTLLYAERATPGQDPFRGPDIWSSEKLARAIGGLICPYGGIDVVFAPVIAD